MNRYNLSQEQLDLIQSGEIDISTFAEFMGFPIPFEEQVVRLHQIKKQLNISWASIASWIGVSVETLKYNAYNTPKRPKKPMPWHRQVLLLYQIREWIRTKDITLTLSKPGTEIIICPPRRSYFLKHRQRSSRLTATARQSSPCSSTQTNHKKR